MRGEEEGLLWRRTRRRLSDVLRGSTKRKCYDGELRIKEYHEGVQKHFPLQEKIEQTSGIRNCGGLKKGPNRRNEMWPLR